MQTSGKRTGAALTVLLALVIAVTVELIRFSGPQFDYLMGSGGVILAAVMALVTYAAPLVITAVLIRRGNPGGQVVLVSVVLLAAARIAVQFLSGTTRLSVGLLAVALGVSATVLVAAVASRFGGILVARGVAAGLFLGAGLSLVMSTFDSIWRASFAGALPAFVLVLAAVVVAALLRTVRPRPYARGVWAVGPVIAMGVCVFANPAFIASQAGVPLWVSAVSLLLGFFFTTIVLRSEVRLALLFAIAAVLSTATIYFVPGWPEPQSALVSIIVVVFSAILGTSMCALLAVLTERSAPRESPSYVVGASAGAGLLIILPVLVFQIDYDIPLGFPNEFVMVALALIVAVPAIVTARKETRYGRLPTRLDAQVTSRPAQLVHVGALAGVAVLTLVGAFVVRPQASTEITDIGYTSATVLNWNLHYGVSLDGEVTWDDMADVIAQSNADVVTLQEISRGWILAGAGDQLTYLANKLGMEYAFVGAADLQFGNAILWDPHVNLENITRTTLEYGDGPQHRSAIGGTMNVAGTEFTIATAHLQHRDSNTPTRMIQIAELFEGLTIADNAVVTGDFNAEPGWPEIQHFESNGFVSAVDVTGDPNAFTFPADSPEVRIDWLFARGLDLGKTSVLESDASDHLPILTTVTPQQ